MLACSALATHFDDLTCLRGGPFWVNSSCQELIPEHWLIIVLVPADIGRLALRTTAQCPAAGRYGALFGHFLVSSSFPNSYDSQNSADVFSSHSAWESGSRFAIGVNSSTISSVRSWQPQ